MLLHGFQMLPTQHQPQRQPTAQLSDGHCRSKPAVGKASCTKHPAHTSDGKLHKGDPFEGRLASINDIITTSFCCCCCCCCRHPLLLPVVPLPSGTQMTAVAQAPHRGSTPVQSAESASAPSAQHLHSRTVQGTAGQYRAWQGSTGQGSTTHGRARRYKPGQGSDLLQWHSCQLAIACLLAGTWATWNKCWLLQRKHAERLARRHRTQLPNQRCLVFVFGNRVNTQMTHISYDAMMQ
jgi:hypothetical protein